MTKEVLTFALNFDREPLCIVEMPGDSLVLSAREQGDSICVWALCDPASERKLKEFVVMGTGHELPEFGDRKIRFIGAANLHGGKMAFHVFEFLD